MFKSVLFFFLSLSSLAPAAEPECRDLLARYLASPWSSILRPVTDPVIKAALQYTIYFSRYGRVRVKGLTDIKGDRGIVFAPNHPSRTDPLIQVLTLHARFRPRPLVFEEELKRPVLGSIIQLANPVAVPSPEGKTRREFLTANRAMLEEVVLGLARGENFLVYPEGQLTKNGRPEVRNVSFIELLLRSAPEARIVMAQMNGMAGSSFGFSAEGQIAEVLPNLQARVSDLRANAFFLTPRRDLTITYREATDFPRSGTREEMNAYLSAFYQAGYLPHRSIPYRWNE